MSGRTRFVITKGDSLPLNLTYKAGKPPAPVDLTDYTARFQVRERPGAPEVLLDLTTENGGIVLGGLAGTIDVTIPESASAGAWTHAEFGLELVPPGDAPPIKLLKGSLSITVELPHD